jgi:hypothetical protein
MNAPEISRPLPARVLSAVMVCNPLLLLSPLCLLYGIYRAVVAPNLFATDTANTIFNFVALACYVLMVCVTSTLLARRGIIPDTVMLLLLNGLLFVAPFILIAHGVFLEGHLAMALGILGMAMAKGQLEVLKRRLPETFVSPQLMIGGALVLASNFAAPMLFRRGLETDNEAWGQTSAYAWYLILPALVAWLNALPTLGRSATIWARPWFALLIYLLWVAGTAVVLWTVAYVDDRHLRAHQFTVALWVLAWTAFRRAELFDAKCASWLQRYAPICAIALPGAGAVAGLDLRIAGLLYALNLPLLALAFGRLPIFALGGISVIGAICCLPSHWIAGVSPELARGEFALLVIFATVLGAVAMLRDPRAGLLAAIGIGIGAGICGLSTALALNASVLFLFLHQLRWATRGRDELVLLVVSGLIWIGHTIALELENSAEVGIACLVATIVVTACLRNAAVGLPTSLIPAIFSMLVLFLHPVHWTATTAAAAPSGMLAILFGFALLALGAWDSARRSQRRMGKF